jgi:hypothetical protein
MDVGEGILVGTVTDPWGNIFGVIENPHFKLEEVHPQIYLATTTYTKG